MCGWRHALNCRKTRTSPPASNTCSCFGSHPRLVQPEEAVDQLERLLKMPYILSPGGQDLIEFAPLRGNRVSSAG